MAAMEAEWGQEQEGSESVVVVVCMMIEAAFWYAVHLTAKEEKEPKERLLG